MEQQGAEKKETAVLMGIRLSSYCRRRCRYLEEHGREMQTIRPD